MKQIRVLAIADMTNAARLEGILDRENINRMALLAPEKMNLERAASLPVDAAVLCTTELNDQECGFLEQLFLIRTDLAMIVLCPSLDTSLMEKAMKCGVVRVMNYNTGPDEICQIIEHEINRLRNRRSNTKVNDYDSRVVSVMSAKGGTGKTTVAVNLAIALQKSQKKTALIDLSLEFGDVGVFLNLPKCEGIADLAGEEKIKASTASNYLFRHGSGVMVLSAPLSPEYAEAVRPEHIERIVTVLRAEYDYLIFDLPSSLNNDCSLAALEQSDVIFLVTTPEIPALKDTKVCLEVLKTLDYFQKVKLILNRDGESYISLRDVENAIGLNPVLTVPNDPKSCVSAINRGIPLVTASPHSKASRAIISFASKDIL